MWSNSQDLGSYNNRFRTIGENMAGDMASGDDYETVRSKRRKRNITEESEARDIFTNSSSENKLNMIFNELQQIRLSQETANRGMRTFQNYYASMNEKLGHVVDVTNTNTSVLKTLAYKSIDMEARSRRNNLIFWGFFETPNENCFSIIREFIADNLDLDPRRMYLTRAHRLGPRKIGYRNPRRPIIVNFRDFCDTEMIMERAHMLKNTRFSIGYDLPKEINAARKKLWDELKAIKSRQPGAKTQIIYPAKLVVDGKVVRDEFPDWNEAMRCSRLSDFSHIDKNFTSDQPSMNLWEIPRSERNTSNQPCWADHVVSDFTMHSKTSSTQLDMNEPEESCDQDRDHSVCSDDVTLPHSKSIEMPENTLNVNETQGNNESTDRPFTRPRSISPEKDGLFRPYDNTLGEHSGMHESSLVLESSKTRNNIPVETRSGSEHRSRPREREPMRPASTSVPRSHQKTSTNNKTGNTSSVNKHSRPCSKNSAQSTQNQTGQKPTSQVHTPTHGVSKNSSAVVNDEHSA